MKKMLDVKNPATGEVIESIALDTAEELEQKVETAWAAQPEWEKKHINERAGILFDFLNNIEAHKHEIGELLAKEMAKPVNSGTGECVDAPEIGRGYVERAKHLYGEVLTGTTADRELDLVFTRREALGVVVGIIPFNYPVEMTIQKSIPAMIMGNTIIVKAPSSNPLTVRRLVELAHESGVPEGVMQFTACERTLCTEHLLKNPKVAAIGLTGSTEAGIDMIKNGADTVKRVFLELGGNDPFIICEDADIETAVQSALEGRLYNNGQVCCATKRFLVHKNIKDAVVDGLKKKLAALRHGSALDPQSQITCLVTEEAAVKVEAQIKKTVEQGGKIVYGGTREGAYICPTIIDDVPADADVAKDMEIFGPVYPIIPFETEEEAIAIANQTKYGLSSGVLSSDTIKAFNIADQLQASAVVVNGQSTYRSNEQPFGGCKASGIGYEGVASSLEEYSRIKTYILKGAFVK
ncbi:aldehyde dehydrogenase family protein [Bacilliculturomica massiliensis]|uniref:aldehyde dehydrogenase family protein n=1 Tax=Bacilliculturomica massiliensis TaxID=1917867 RepID=UPI0012B78D83|nr:aldehyde dehydrogenase family protein [Bacilliculturomica massiliensis]